MLGAKVSDLLSKCSKASIFVDEFRGACVHPVIVIEATMMFETTEYSLECQLSCVYLPFTSSSVQSWLL